MWKYYSFPLSFWLRSLSYAWDFFPHMSMVDQTFSKHCWFSSMKHCSNQTFWRVFFEAPLFVKKEMLLSQSANIFLKFLLMASNCGAWCEWFCEGAGQNITNCFISIAIHFKIFEHVHFFKLWTLTLGWNGTSSSKSIYMSCFFFLLEFLTLIRSTVKYFIITVLNFCAFGTFGLLKVFYFCTRRKKQNVLQYVFYSNSILSF